MNKFYLFPIFLLYILPLYAQVNYTANDQVLPYNGSFRPGLNSGIYNGFSDEDLADLAAGNPAIGNKGVGTKALRPGLFESFTNVWGVDSRVSTFQHYLNLDIKDNTVIVGFPAPEHQDPNYYCADEQSQLFAGMYEPIWDDGSDGTPYNEANIYAAYLWELVNTYQDYVKFWEIWNEPGFDYTGSTGYLEPGQEGNWWDNNPEPCDYKLRAPIFHYVRLLRISWEIIKSVDSSAYVCVSGTGYPAFLDAILRNTDNPSNGSITEDYPLQGGAYFDVFGFHSYPHFDGSLREYSNEINGFINFRHSDAAAAGISGVRADYQDVFDVYGYDGTTYPEKLWTVTECNLPRVQYDDYIGSAEAQRNFMIKAYVECVANDFVQLDIYKIAEDKTDATADNEFDLMGLYYQLSAADMYFNEPNDAGIAMRTATDLLFGKTYDPTRTAAMNLGDDTKGAAFVDDYGNYTYVIWAKTDTDQSEIANALYSFPAAWNTTNLLRREWNYGATNETSITGGVGVELTAAPVFFTELSFAADNLIGCAPLSVQFTDLSNASAVSWQWDFEGENAPLSSNLQNPQLTLFLPGCYTATMQAFDINGQIVAQQTQDIEVVAPVEPDFSTEISGPVVHFFNQSSINSESFEWDFGDGTTSSEANPMHLYLASGEYTVSLTAADICGEVSYSQVLSVTAPDLYLTDYSANDTVPEFNADFRAGYNFGYYPAFSDEDLADIAAGNPETGIKGIGAKSVRTFLGEFFVNFWGYDVREEAFQYYENLGIADAALTLDFPEGINRDSTEYCSGQPSKLFKDLYLPIWIESEEGTQINPDNPYAVYVYNMVQTYGSYVKYWEIVNSPDFDLTGEKGYLPPGEPDNWWENNPEPCDYQLRAPIFHYIRTLRIAYEVIKHLQPNDYVAISGIGFPSFLDAVLRNTDNPLDGSPTQGYEKTGGAYFDMIGFKSYPHFDGATSYYDLEIGGFAYERHSDAAAEGIELVKGRFESVLENYGYGTSLPAKEWIIAEANVPRFPFDEFLGGETVQRNWITKAYVEAAKNNIRQFNIFNLSEREAPEDADSPFDALGLYQKLDDAAPGEQIVNQEGIALRTTSQLLFGRSYAPTQTAAMNLPPEVNGAAFVSETGDYIYVIWAKTDTDLSESNTAVYSFPSNWNISELYRREWDFGETETTTLISASNIPLTASPIFLTEEENILQAPLASFSADTTRVCPEFEIQFSNTSFGEELSYFWEFEGGSPATSTAENPLVNYNESGIFDVVLTVSNSAGSHTQTLPNYIEIIEAPMAGFDVTIDEQWASFENTSEGSFYYFWNFGDSDELVNAENPQHFYITNGTYEVEMIAFNDCASDTITQLITIGAAPNVGFSYDILGGCTSSSVDFHQQTSSSPTAWQWEFPGGVPSSSTEQFPPDVVYETPGTYTVSLTASNEFGSNETTAEFYIYGNVSTDITADLCEDESIVIEGEIFDIDQPTGTIVLQTEQGCDSTISVNLNFFDTYNTNLSEIINQGETYIVGDSIYTQSGIYTDTLQSLNGCDSIVNLNLTVLTSLKDIHINTFKLEAAPNPFKETLNISFELAEPTNISLNLTDIHGRQVKNIISNTLWQSGLSEVEIATDKLPAGVYFLKINTTNREYAMKVVKI